MRRIIWAITGSGSFLRDLADMFTEVRNTCGDLEIAIILSRAGKEVSRIYGVWDTLESVATDTRYGGVYVDTGPAAWLPLLGRVGLGRYGLVIVAPATSNTVAKVVHGIADTLVTAVVSQALKSGTLVVVLPSDYCEESVTQLPCRVNAEGCTKCYTCLNVGFCPHNAIVLSDEYPVIDYSRCEGCGECELKCPAGAIKCWEEVSVRPSAVDLENLHRLKGINNVRVVYSINELKKLMITTLRGCSEDY